MTFSQLTSGTRIHVLEITGTFKKNTTYSLGTVVSVSKPYDEPVPPTQFPMPMQNRRKLVDLVISCDGEQRKLSVSEDKTMMTDSSIGLTIATEKSQIVNMVRQSLDDCRIKKESLSKIDEEMRRCEDILKILNINSDITTNVTKDFKELDDLKAEVKELKQLLQNVSAVRPEVIKNTPPNSAEDKKVEPEGEIKKEIETIRERKITVKLSDADCDRLARKCGVHGLTIGELIANFVGDLVGGTYSNGSDERDYADQWFERCWFGMFPEPTLLNHLLNFG